MYAASGTRRLARNSASSSLRNNVAWTEGDEIQGCWPLVSTAEVSIGFKVGFSWTHFDIFSGSLSGSLNMR